MRQPHHAPRPLLEIRDLRVQFATPQGTATAINGVDLQLAAGQCLGILGESGSGKSVTARTIMGLLDTPPARVAGGEILLNGEDLLSIGAKRRRQLTGPCMSMVFQDALSALNPVHPVGRQIGELFRVHRGYSRKAAKAAAIEMMDRVRIPAAASRVNDYPHQFSGGMRQRIVIAMALALGPELLIADEPTTALDVTVQAQILELLKEQQAENNMGLILITHDISVVREVTDQVAVMYAGRIIEQGPTAQVLSAPRHPYTRGLAESVASEALKGHRLPAIPGSPPDLLNIPVGCSFANRCFLADEACTAAVPALEAISAGRQSACFHSQEVPSHAAYSH
ncbi:methionine ABC transporter ATP-binding protein [Arthrobacter sp. MYb211]|uniref:ABC transporter ATP-binding protein n=1 Tax=Micrococcaceae TaxID=1268 RepID=UPI000CFBDB5D|nr:MULTISPECIES: ABC transporter ATP-binding protein [unclassified Arthrobacter]PQZ98201.1 methionine ABC transporter ATP-binding protein [Arthrobacter sp. MYb224]PRA02393.1 methionine ABC transporter ATP-binding protein [Arthrobacter sp. MYb229]PRA13418.1 methionine ABC transporter ATP-binding protein [Arthrobacter sp. MYb221]PRB50664.1 methionine ABC transporter ATP-binding protein [Arthrobacter sp. MYb216]PRC10616.1 methionine ABC transporter ATP-binding protein [Arthrobacter sp. MYb211]